MNKFKLLLAGLLLLGANLYSQTELDNQEKYWNYRDRFRKFFTQIGEKPGFSIPLNSIQIHDGPTISTNGAPKKLLGSIEFGDAMVDQGLYLSVLATEYKILLDTHQDLTAIRNELYYAIEAVKRVDKFAETYYDINNAGELNGFFVRCDAPNTFYEAWENLGDPIYNHTSGYTQGRNPQILKPIPEI